MVFEQLKRDLEIALVELKTLRPAAALMCGWVGVKRPILGVTHRQIAPPSPVRRSGACAEIWRLCGNLAVKGSRSAPSTANTAKSCGALSPREMVNCPRSVRSRQS